MMQRDNAVFVKSTRQRETERLDAYRAGYLAAAAGRGLSTAGSQEWVRAYMDGARDWKRESRETR